MRANSPQPVGMVEATGSGSENGSPWKAQFVVTTHSAHVANRTHFSNIRYFRKEEEAAEPGDEPRPACTAVKDLSHVSRDEKFLLKHLTLTRAEGSSITMRAGDAKVHGRLLRVAPIELAELVLGTSQADLETFDLAEPAFCLGFGDSGDEVVADLGKPCPLGRVRPEEGASDARDRRMRRCRSRCVWAGPMGCAFACSARGASRWSCRTGGSWVPRLSRCPRCCSGCLRPVGEGLARSISIVAADNKVSEVQVRACASPTSTLGSVGCWRCLRCAQQGVDRCGGNDRTCC